MRMLVLSLFVLAGCEAQIGTEAKQGAAAALKAEAGTLSIDAPGFDLKLKIPESVRAQVGADGEFVYPGSTLGGLHVAAGDSGQGAGSVELRFTTPDAIEEVAAWYRDPARAAELAVADIVRQETGMVITGTSRGEGDPFTLRLAPADGGGTEARLVLRDQTG